MNSQRLFIYSLGLMVYTWFLAGCGKEVFDRDKLTFPTIDGQVISLSAYPNKWLVLNYWASWCKPCYTEIPELNKLVAAYPNDILLLGVSYDLADEKQKLALAKKIGIRFPTLAVDPAAELGLEQVLVLPTTFIFNPEGQLVAKLTGEQTKASLEEKMGFTQNAL